MDKLFLQIINMSIASCYVILFVIVVRILLRKAPKIFSYVLWSVVLFRLLCSFSFDSIYSLMPDQAQGIYANTMGSQLPSNNGGIMVNIFNSSMTGISINPMQILVSFGTIIWLLGVGILLTHSIITAKKLYVELKSANLVYDNIYETDIIDTPFVFGTIKPKIYLPIGLSHSERAYIIKHEQIHIKRLDHIVKPIAFFALCIHWFNPLVWVAFLLISNDMELSCDESVIKKMGSEIKKKYSTSLLALSTGNHILGGYPIAFGETNIKARIENILDHKKMEVWVIISTVIVVIVVCVGLMINPKYDGQMVKKELNIVDLVDYDMSGTIGYAPGEGNDGIFIEIDYVPNENGITVNKIHTTLQAPIGLVSYFYKNIYQSCDVIDDRIVINFVGKQFGRRKNLSYMISLTGVDVVYDAALTDRSNFISKLM